MRLAVFLAQRGYNVSVIIKDVGFIINEKNANIFYYFNNLYQNNVNIMFLSRIIKINDDNIDVLVCKNLAKNSYSSFLKIVSNERFKIENQQQNIDCDLLIYEPELISNSKLYAELVNARYPNELYIIGNALEISDMADDIKSAYFVGKNL